MAIVGIEFESSTNGFIDTNDGIFSPLK